MSSIMIGIDFSFDVVGVAVYVLYDANILLFWLDDNDAVSMPAAGF